LFFLLDRFKSVEQLPQLAVVGLRKLLFEAVEFLESVEVLAHLQRVRRNLDADELVGGEAVFCTQKRNDLFSALRRETERASEFDYNWFCLFLLNKRKQSLQFLDPEVPFRVSIHLESTQSSLFLGEQLFN